MVKINMLYRCPLCFERLELFDSMYHCINNHNFDRSKLGYVNLLPVQNKNSKQPGDSKEMLTARRTFLNSGHYQPLSEAVIALAKAHLTDDKINSYLDVGCGEGYYLKSLIASMPMLAYGIDISKEGILLAAKGASLQENYSVASCSNLPFVNESFDLITRIFSPSDANELRRVIKSTGFLITVTPGPRHHFQLKEIIYEHPRLHQQDLLIERFEMVLNQTVNYPLLLTDPESIRCFLDMTPYAWKLTKEQKENLIAQGVQCEIDFNVTLYKPS